MKKGILATILSLCLCLALVGCGKEEITLHLAYGDRTGTYSGETNDEGLPHGQGKFTSTNENGGSWTYEGEFKNGHFDGEGKTTWKSGAIEYGTYKDDVLVPLSGKEIKPMYSNPKEFEHRCVEIVGRVFTEPEYDEDGVYLQIWGDVKNSSNSAIIYIQDRDFEVAEDDYIHIVGIVAGDFTGTNAFGGDITVPTIAARSYEVLDYKDAVAPTLKEYELNEAQTQHGYSITLQKVELAESETRVYVKVDNQGTDSFNVYSFNAKLIQNGKQFEEQSNWEADYPEVQTDLLVGNSTEGIIAFPAIGDGAFSVMLEGRSDNWHEDFDPFTFTIEP